LYFRLNVFPIVVPPLRERADDIPELVQHFASHSAYEHNLKRKPIEPAVLNALCQHQWPGNIRELRNTIDRMLIMARRPRRGGALGAALPQVGTLRAFKEESERAFLVARLREQQWNISKTAETLDTPRSNVYKKLEHYAISQERDG
jgi:two-component system nitrogen regulation response regulator NtrX